MDTKLEIQRLRHRVQELEQENAELRARLATFDTSGPTPGKDNGATSSKTQRPANTASASNTGASATDSPASACNATSAPFCRADTASVTAPVPPPRKFVCFAPCSAAAATSTPCAGIAKRRRVQPFPSVWKKSGNIFWRIILKMT